MKKNAARLRTYIQAMTRLVGEHGHDEARMLADGEVLLKGLIGNDDWLPDEFALPSTESYRQYLLHCDPLERFSVVSFVWGPGQKTPVHDHTVWGLVGVLRGAEACEEFDLRAGQPVANGHCHTLQRGQIEAVSPTMGDWHRVANALPDQASISIHVYGGDIGSVRRHRLDADGRICDFVSGYTAAPLPALFGAAP